MEWEQLHQPIDKLNKVGNILSIWNSFSLGKNDRSKERYWWRRLRDSNRKYFKGIPMAAEIICEKDAVFLYEYIAVD